MACFFAQCPLALYYFTLYTIRSSINRRPMLLLGLWSQNVNSWNSKSVTEKQVVLGGVVVFFLRHRSAVRIPSFNIFNPIFTANWIDERTSVTGLGYLWRALVFNFLVNIGSLWTINLATFGAILKNYNILSQHWNGNYMDRSWRIRPLFITTSGHAVTKANVSFKNITF